MKLIRKILIKFLGIEGYIKLASRVYLSMVRHGYLKKQYPELFYLKKIIKPGNTCIDIGANLGYYSTLMSHLAGENGRIYAVEPIPMFYNIWKKNVKRSGHNNLELFPYALGGEQKNVKMGMPERDGLLHHGMTKVVSSANENYQKFFDVEMRMPDVLFANINRLDFVKCDVEGYESEVFSNMKETLKRFKPLVQSELNGNENRMKVINLFESLGYTPKILNESHELRDITSEEKLTLSQDFYFVPEK
ncbi:MAG: hypothetical protein A2275_13280 [Bacteroidetes bacterium RIFOXYA12_FULL_35_11]|nr:MAG: hypothetical protein A2X01_01550 [Bacteroidetes bacterium GWF2_35_48]OFY76062.1 MAG: hypothetical protein A2275_13280 [Bacteroidetes bacterium RIFOXYA12_FULL_35_11]OFY93453.1 MAG: hypothetical protein A2309_11905 [Bacteroidetes bacterium RIFOXYB2_FULL_35_7]OFZ03298.1 MAG: hypothetical protein A2491_18460 [Bacteroidetes bacterium RIFOXYC12_FULL_35_7]HBX51886.1 hypothetical protein [Bacteroidales bacterium]